MRIMTSPRTRSTESTRTRLGLSAAPTEANAEPGASVTDAVMTGYYSAFPGRRPPRRHSDRALTFSGIPGRAAGTSEPFPEFVSWRQQGGRCPMRTYGKSRSTTASPERVWSIWRDPNNWNKWNTGIRDCAMDGGGPLANGATALMVTNRG